MTFTIPNSPRLTELERNWFQVRVPGANARTPLGELKKLFYKSVVGANFKTFAEAEFEWIKYQIREAGGTPSDTNHESVLWRELVAALGGTPYRRIEENKRYFYQNVTT